ncbi:hypothetical protein BMW23_0284 [Bodo saltans virus]|uniref:Transmembrane protein n=1 Tax=Bodo saltans virus TaxID=2024608 RepID=A0A2H4UTT4_9VIRU|nr:hypothetical protein QJ851_gp0279 [Bodo saltans virus]ATZ80342.1 hypothetical protein BMW23_0284 [Bodo saltans virus]
MTYNHTLFETNNFSQEFFIDSDDDIINFNIYSDKNNISDNAKKNKSDNTYYSYIIPNLYDDDTKSILDIESPTLNYKKKYPLSTIYNYTTTDFESDDSQTTLNNREHFGNIVAKSNNYIYFILAFIVITILLFLAALHDMNAPYLCLYK